MSISVRPINEEPMESLPLSVFEAAVQVAGSALHYKNSLKQLLRSSGVSANGAERYSDLTKYQMFRNTWGDLDRAGTPGRKVQPLGGLGSNRAAPVRDDRRPTTYRHTTERSPQAI